MAGSVAAGIPSGPAKSFAQNTTVWSLGLGIVRTSAGGACEFESPCNRPAVGGKKPRDRPARTHQLHAEDTTFGTRDGARRTRAAAWRRIEFSVLRTASARDETRVGIAD